MRRTLTTPSLRWRALLVLNLVALAALLSWTAWQSRPVAMHDLHLADGEKLQCVSYAPFHLPGQTPFDPDLHIEREQIVADLTALARITHCVRLYSVSQGLEAVPAMARELGLSVLLGAWIGYDREKNAAELDRAIDLANANADVVSALIVGNEVLLRRERTPAEMRELIAYAQAHTDIPVTYADVWEFWLQNRELADVVDQVTVHILPFWEDEPVHINHAVDHVARVLEKVRQAFEKPVMIGETGWPSAGRQREKSLPSRVNQARYVREFVHRAHQEGWRYNLIEAIDQPWKRTLEGTVGGHWGMLDAGLDAKFPLAGGVAEREDVRAPLGGMLAGALLCLWLARGVRAGALQRATAISGGAVGGLAVTLHLEHALLAYRTQLEWSVLGAVALAGALLPLTLARWRGDSTVPAVAHAWHAFRSATARGGAAPLLGLLRGVLLFAAAVAALLLAVDPRYRDFPLALYLLPALYAGLFAWISAENGREERLCGAIIVLACLARWSTEPANPQALAWLATGLALGLPALTARTTPERQ
jgi:exo-beta-1,3-glucanase (GH17 family)